jgi:fermentation-respiration switch protein FrsA (DUF1100 family)
MVSFLIDPLVDFLLYHPPSDQDHDDDQESDEFCSYLTINNSPCLLCTPAAGTTPTHILIYCHSNATFIRHPSLVRILKQAADHLDVVIVAVEYPGYYGRQETTADAINKSVSAAVDWVKTTLKWCPSRIVLWGTSLGTGPATVVAAKHHPDIGGLILQCPYKSIRDMASQMVLAKNASFVRSFLTKHIVLDRMTERWNTAVTIKDTVCPVLFLHGLKDTMIPASHSLALHTIARESKCRQSVLHFSKDATHGIANFDNVFDVWPVMQSFLSCHVVVSPKEKESKQ